MQNLLSSMLRVQSLCYLLISLCLGVACPPCVCYQFITARCGRSSIFECTCDEDEFRFSACATGSEISYSSTTSFSHAKQFVAKPWTTTRNTSSGTMKLHLGGSCSRFRVHKSCHLHRWKRIRILKRNHQFNPSNENSTFSLFPLLLLLPSTPFLFLSLSYSIVWFDNFRRTSQNSLKFLRAS